MDNIPLTAWQQAAIVVLFIIFVVLLLNWFSKQSQTWRDFMLEMNNRWQEFNKAQRNENTNAMCDVSGNLQELVVITQEMVREVREMRVENRETIEALQAHDKRSIEIKNVVEDLKHKKG